MNSVNSIKSTPELNLNSTLEYDICPICKKSVRITRHNKALCAEICRRKQLIETTAKNALKKANRLNKSK
jgi:hypothetical protein